MAGVDTPEKRERTFWYNCVPLRVVLALAMVIASVEEVRLLQLLLATYMGSWGVGFLIFFAQKQYNDTTIQYRLERASDPDLRAELYTQIDKTKYGNFGGVVWWQWPRLVHGTLLVAYAASTFAAWRYAYVFGLADVTFGVAAGVFYYGGCTRPS